MHVRHLALALACAAPLTLAAQQTQPSAGDFRWEKTLPAGNYVSLHNLNGNVTVSPSSTGKVEILGRKRGNSRYFDEVTLEIVESSRGIMVCSMFRGADMDCDESGFRMQGRRGYRDRDYDDVSIDIEVKLPRGLEVDARSVSGDVSVTGADGDVRASSVSGDVRMERLRASGVRASSVSGNVFVLVDTLLGSGDLRFSSVSGDVTAELPKGIDADVTMRSVSGQLDSEFPLTLNGRMSRSRLEARIGRGGRQLEVSTVSGDVRLRATK